MPSTNNNDNASAAKTAQTRPEITTLYCSCCGAVTSGRQWDNRDTGYGICPACYVQNKIAHVKYGYMDVPEHGGQSYFGVRGYHWDVEDETKEVDILEAREHYPHYQFEECNRSEVPADWKGTGMAQRIVIWLQHFGVMATVEYPGVVYIPTGDGKTWVFGDSNELWGGDLVEDGELGNVIKSVEIPFSSDNKSNGFALTAAICAAIMIEGLTKEQIRFAGSVQRGLCRGFEAVHEFCDANMLLPGHMHYEANDEEFERFLNLVVEHATERLVK